MKQWDIWSWEFRHATHPAVILTPDAWLHLDCVNVLDCSSQPASRAPLPYEVILDEADGLEWPTLCRCHRIWYPSRQEIRQHRGQVSIERRREIGTRLIRVFGLWLP